MLELGATQPLHVAEPSPCFARLSVANTGRQAAKLLISLFMHEDLEPREENNE
jgi:hypothetical protein